MRYDEWEPYYKAILEDFGWTPEGDEAAARLLSLMLPYPSYEMQKARELIEGKDVLVCGKAPCLKKELEGIERQKYTIIAADGSVSTLLRHGIVPDIIVSDLDGSHRDILKANKKGAIIFAHAHADNIENIKSLVPELMNVIGTTQSEPLHNIFNFGGFSDGDRCVFIAREFNAKSIKIIGFDLDDKKVTRKKLKKLMWARKLLKTQGIDL